MSLSIYQESEGGGSGDDRISLPLLPRDEENPEVGGVAAGKEDGHLLRAINLFTLVTGLEWQGYGSYQHDRGMWLATMWSRYLNAMLVLGTFGVIPNLFIDVIYLARKHQEDTNNLILANLSYGFGSLVQNLLCFLALRVWRRAKKQREQLHNYCVETSFDAFASAKRQMQPICGFIMVFTVLTCIFLVITSDSSIEYHLAINIFYSITSIIPYSLIICGLATTVLATLLYLEHYLEAFHTRIASGEAISCAEYLHVHKRFQQIWKPQTRSAFALACLLLSTAWNVFNRTVVLLLVYPYLLHTSSTDQTSMLLTALLFVGRELIVLTLILDKIGRINAQAQKLHKTLVRQRWTNESVVAATSTHSVDLSRQTIAVRSLSTRDSLSVFHLEADDEGVEVGEDGAGGEEAKNTFVDRNSRSSNSSNSRRRRHLPDVTAASSSMPLTTMLDPHSSRETERLSLCLLIIDTPLTVALFGMQFSLSQLRLQFLVVLGGFLLAFLRALLIAQFRL